METEEGSPRASPFLFRPARRRFLAQHPFFEDGDVHRHLSLQDLLLLPPPPPREEEEEQPDSGQEGRKGRPPGFPCPAAGCPQAFASLESCEHHYQVLHRHTCAACQRVFPSAHLLDLHLLEWHDALFRVMAEKGDMYQCLVESCPGRFKGAKERKEHLINIHQYPPDFRFNRPLTCKSPAKEKRPRPSEESSVPMELNVEEPRGQVPVDAMDVVPSESTVERALKTRTKAAWGGVSEPPEKPLSRYRVPPTICFGHGATRSFKGRREKH